MRRRLVSAALAATLALAACQSDGRRLSASQNAELDARAQRITRRLTSTGGVTTNEALARWIMPPSLAEVSGLAVLDSTRVVTHNDESARLAVVDFRRGVVVKQFSLGDEPVHGDFEGIAAANGRLWLLESNGALYEFAEGREGEHVPFVRHDTRLGKECEFEGLAFDPAVASLLLACKRVTAGGERDQLVVYRWALDRRAIAPEATVIVPFDRFGTGGSATGLHPSGIAVDPSSGDYVLVAARERALVVLTPEGDVVDTHTLPPVHGQAEGIDITADGLLLIGDEASTQPAAITVYQWPAPTSTRGTQ